jgi:hypothetical protein
MVIASFALSVVALGSTLVVAIRQARLMSSANTLPVLVDFFREIRSASFRDDQRILHERLSACLPEDGLYRLPEDVRRAAISTLRYYDNLGAMVAHKIISPDIVLSRSRVSPSIASGSRSNLS